MKRILLSWSSGKDSAWSLHLLQQQNQYEIVGLLTTFNQEANRVAMHAVRRSLVEAQARAAGIPLWDVDLPWPCSNADYECIMTETCKAAVQAGIECIAFGDLFLTDIRAYREKQLENSGLRPIFPLWGMPTPELSRSMIKSGVRAKLTCVDPKLLAPEFPQISTLVARTENFTPSYTQAQCSSTTCRSRWEKLCLATDLCLLT